MDCIFCKIVAGAIPSFKVYEDANTLAFMDINPLTEGHTLVIPKKHAATLMEADDAMLQSTIVVAKKVGAAVVKAMKVDAVNLLQANGRWAGQSVPHLHFHLIPRREEDGAGLDWVLQPGEMAAIKGTAEKIAPLLK
jgi:histidine triad (HIT) family protein